MKKGIIFAVLLSLLLAFAAAGIACNPPPVVEDPKVEAVLLKTSTTLFVGGNTERLNAEVTGTVADKTVSFSITEGADFISLAENGTVTPVLPGVARVRATANADDTKYAECRVTVIAHPTGVALNKNSLTLIIGYTETLTAVVAPDFANDTSVSWHSDDEQIATVSQSGLVTAVSEGFANITVKTQVGDQTDVCVVEVIAPKPATHIQIISDSTSLYAGETLNLSVTYTPHDTTHTGVVWSSSNPQIASVSQEGVVTAIGVPDGGNGTVTIFATYAHNNQVVGQQQFTVHTPVTSLTLTRGGAVFTADYFEMNFFATGDSRNTAAAIFNVAVNEDASFKGINISITGADGVVTPTINPTQFRIAVLGRGIAHVTVTAADNPSVTRTVEFRVIQRVTGITTVPQVELPSNSSFTLTSAVVPANANNQTVTYSILNTSTAAAGTVSLGAQDGLSIIVNISDAAVAGTFADIRVSSADGNFSATCRVNIVSGAQEITSIIRTDNNNNVEDNQSSPIELVKNSLTSGLNTVTLGVVLDPVDALEMPIFTSLNPTVASVGELSGVVTGLSKGTAEIVVSINNGETLSTWVSVEVLATSVTIDNSHIALYTNPADGTQANAQTLLVTGVFDGLLNGAPTAETVTWSLVNPLDSEFVTIDAASGEVTALKATGSGGIKVRATVDDVRGVYAECMVVVVTHVESLSITAKPTGLDATLYINGIIDTNQLDLGAISFTFNGGITVSDISATWSVVSGDAVRIENGMLIAQNSGFATVRITSNENPTAYDEFEVEVIVYASVNSSSISADTLLFEFIEREQEINIVIEGVYTSVDWSLIGDPLVVAFEVDTDDYCIVRLEALDNGVVTLRATITTAVGVTFTLDCVITVEILIFATDIELLEPRALGLNNENLDNVDLAINFTFNRDGTAVIAAKKAQLVWVYETEGVVEVDEFGTIRALSVGIIKIWAVLYEDSQLFDEVVSNEITVTVYNGITGVVITQDGIALADAARITLDIEEDEFISLTAAALSGLGIADADFYTVEWTVLDGTSIALADLGNIAATSFAVLGEGLSEIMVTITSGDVLSVAYAVTLEVNVMRFIPLLAPNPILTDANNWPEVIQPWSWWTGNRDIVQAAFSSYPFLPGTFGENQVGSQLAVRVNFHDMSTGEIFNYADSERLINEPATWLPHGIVGNADVYRDIEELEIARRGNVSWGYYITLQTRLIGPAEWGEYANLPDFRQLIKNSPLSNALPGRFFNAPGAIPAHPSFFFPTGLVTNAIDLFRDGSELNFRRHDSGIASMEVYFFDDGKNFENNIHNAKMVTVTRAPGGSQTANRALIYTYNGTEIYRGAAGDTWILASNVKVILEAVYGAEYSPTAWYSIGIILRADDSVLYTQDSMFFRPALPWRETAG